MNDVQQEMSREQKVETIARCCHEANRAWCAAHGDESLHPWLEESGAQRRSLTKGVEVALSGATPEEQHQAWLEHKQSEGWRFGAVKDDMAKTHPAMLPFGRLPEFHRVKCELFGAIVRELAAPLRLESAA